MCGGGGGAGGGQIIIREAGLLDLGVFCPRNSTGSPRDEIRETERERQTERQREGGRREGEFVRIVSLFMVIYTVEVSH